MEGIDRALLNEIQSGFPLNLRPYLAIGNRLGITEEEVLERLNRLKEIGVIKKIAAIFEPRKLDYKSILCALKVEGKRLDEVAAIINSYPGVTHNYIREHAYNMWFTLIAPSEGALNHTLDEIERKVESGRLLRMRAKKVFKIKVNFDLRNGRHGTISE